MDEEPLRNVMASVFGVPVDAVAIADDAEQLAATPPMARVILERDRQHRDFPLQIVVILRDDGLAQRFDGFEGVLRMARELADGVGADVLFADGPVTPSE